MAETKVIELAKKLHAHRQEYEATAEELKQMLTTWEAIELELIEAMVESGVSSVKIDGLGLFTYTVTNIMSVTAANKETFYPYLTESGNGGLLKLDVNPRTLSAFLKQHVEDLIQKNEASGMDTVDAREKALEFLAARGASYFTKRGVTMRNGK